MSNNLECSTCKGRLVKKSNGAITKDKRTILYLFQCPACKTSVTISEPNLEQDAHVDRFSAKTEVKGASSYTQQGQGRSKDGGKGKAKGKNKDDEFVGKGKAKKPRPKD